MKPIASAVNAASCAKSARHSPRVSRSSSPSTIQYVSLHYRLRNKRVVRTYTISCATQKVKAQRETAFPLCSISTPTDSTPR
ncbi:hypothetical protein KCP71_06585 [Salmonella enterica subsp. enterica]|nr:hypothetical protein KCP71_06585 [Salmonella enterica subsp. enterica]